MDKKKKGHSGEAASNQKPNIVNFSVLKVRKQLITLSLKIQNKGLEHEESKQIITEALEEICNLREGLV